MQFSIFLLIILVIALCYFGYMTYRQTTDKRKHDNKRNQYNDRV